MQFPFLKYCFVISLALFGLLASIHYASAQASLLFGTPKFCAMDIGTVANPNLPYQFQGTFGTDFQDLTIKGFFIDAYIDTDLANFNWTRLNSGVTLGNALGGGSLHYHVIVWPKTTGWGAMAAPNDGFFEAYEQLATNQERRDYLKLYLQTLVVQSPDIDVYDLVNHPLRHPAAYPSSVDYMLTGKDRVDAIADLFRWANDANDSSKYTIAVNIR